jgi:hypothetical protein
MEWTGVNEDDASIMDELKNLSRALRQLKPAF